MVQAIWKLHIKPKVARLKQVKALLEGEIDIGVLEKIKQVESEADKNAVGRLDRSVIGVLGLDES